MKEGIEFTIGVSMADYEFNKNCTSLNIINIYKALGKAYLNLSTCMMGLCASQNFKRSLYFHLPRGTIACDGNPEKGIIMHPYGRWLISPRDGEGIAFSSLGGFGEKVKYAERTLNFTEKFWEMRLGYGSDKSCLANELVHETMHPVIEMMAVSTFRASSALPPWWPSSVEKQWTST